MFYFCHHHKFSAVQHSLSALYCRGKTCSYNPSPDPTLCGSFQHWVCPFFTSFLQELGAQARVIIMGKGGSIYYYSETLSMITFLSND
jgi:hypothetical protein